MAVQAEIVVGREVHIGAIADAGLGASPLLVNAEERVLKPEHLGEGALSLHLPVARKGGEVGRGGGHGWAFTLPRCCCRLSAGHMCVERLPLRRREAAVSTTGQCIRPFMSLLRAATACTTELIASLSISIPAWRSLSVWLTRISSSGWAASTKPIR